MKALLWRLPFYWQIKDSIWRVRHWWKGRWFRRNRQKLRNVAAWAVHHSINGGAHDRNTILAGNADRRIHEAANGHIGN